jgi:hypothetical protein
MTGMRLDAKMGLYDVSDPRPGPQVGGKARRPGPPKPDRLQCLLLLWGESGAASRMGLGGQRLRPSRLQGLFPLVDRCGGDADGLGHFLNTLALRKQYGWRSGAASPIPGQSLEVS